MTTRDWIYISLIALTGVAFYRHGYYAGVWRSRKVFESLLGQIEDGQVERANAQQTVQFDRRLGRGCPRRPARPENRNGRLPEDFWDN